MRNCLGTTKRVCGDFAEPTIPQQGRCHTYRLKTSCEAPSLPSIIFFNDEVEFTNVCPDGAMGYPITVVIPSGTVPSPTSLADANIIACNEAENQAALLRLMTPCVFVNDEQICENLCPEGTIGYPITVTVPYGTVISYISKEAANAEALAQACAQASEERELAPCTTGLPPGVMWGWGRNFRGEVGVGNTFRQPAPALIAEASLDWTKLKKGGGFGLGLKTNGTMWAWGENYEGQLGQGTQSIYPSTAYDSLVPIQVGIDGDWAEVDCGEQFAAALKNDGTLWTWGYNSSGQLGLGDTTDRLVPTQVGTDTDWVQIAVATDHMAALKSDGTIWACGANSEGCLGNGTLLDSDIFVQSGPDTDWSYVAVNHTGVGGNAVTTGIKTDGTMWACGHTLDSPGSVANFTLISLDPGWAQFSAGFGFQIALKTDGTLWSRGWNIVGMLGLGDLIRRTEFTQIGTDTDWISLSCGSLFTMAQKADGSLWGWGQNANSELGQGGQSTGELVPTQIGSDNLWITYAPGFNDGGAIRSVVTYPAPPPITNGVANGGTYNIIGGNTTHTFEANGTFEVYTEFTGDVLLVGGGGGGGGAGGGGAGEFKKLVGVTIPVGTYAVIVPHYALGAFGGNQQGDDGGTVTFNGEQAVGGGGGGAGTAGSDEPSIDPDGRPGASGGGGGLDFASPFDSHPGGSSTAGFDGGASSSGPLGSGAGGGGFSSVGSDGASDIGGDGGSGISDSISGAALIYAAGGAGAGSTTGGLGGDGVGGNGASASTVTRATSGITPGSGGGGTYKDAIPLIQFTITAGSGQHGTVIISYPTPP